MKLLVDETLGMIEMDEVIHKPVQTKNGSLSLDAVVERTGSKLGRSKLPINPYTQTEEITFFTERLKGIEQIVYFYDSSYTDRGTIQRLQNWLYPDQELLAIPIDGNRATLFMLIEKALDHRGASLQQLRTILEHAAQSAEQWLLTPMPKAFRNLFSTYKLNSKKLNHYKLIHSDQKLESKGEISELADQVFNKTTPEQQVWIVQKGVSVEPDSNRQVKVLTLDETNLPLHVPYVHISIL